MRRQAHSRPVRRCFPLALSGLAGCLSPPCESLRRFPSEAVDGLAPGGGEIAERFTFRRTPLASGGQGDPVAPLDPLRPSSLPHGGTVVEEGRFRVPGELGGLERLKNA